MSKPNGFSNSESNGQGSSGPLRKAACPYVPEPTCQITFINIRLEKVAFKQLNDHWVSKRSGTNKK